jgi:hypothetical protein
MDSVEVYTLDELKKDIIARNKSKTDSRNIAIKNAKIEYQQAIVSKYRPSIREYMDLAGVDFYMASQLLYRSPGSSDNRDWEKIMSSKDTVSAILEENKRLMNDISTPLINPIDKRYIISSTENLVLYSQGN